MQAGVLVAVGGGVLRARRDRARPHRQGHPHGAARRADLAVDAPATSATRSACTARSTRPARCSARSSRSRSSPWRRGAYDVVFVVSFCVALVGVARAAAVRPQPQRAGGRAEAARRRAAPLGAAAPRRAFARSSSSPRASAWRPSATRSSICGSSATVDAALFPLLYVGTALVYLLLAVPAGRLADRIGRGRVFLGGYVLLLGVYVAAAARPSGAPGSARRARPARRLLRGTDGVLMALAGARLPAQLRGSGLALLTTVTSVARLVARSSFGAVWVAIERVDGAVGLRRARLVLALAVAAPSSCCRRPASRPCSRRPRLRRHRGGVLAAAAFVGVSAARRLRRQRRREDAASAAAQPRRPRRPDRRRGRATAAAPAARSSSAASQRADDAIRAARLRAARRPGRPPRHRCLRARRTSPPAAASACAARRRCRLSGRDPVRPRPAAAARVAVAACRAAPGSRPTAATARRRSSSPATRTPSTGTFSTGRR